MVRSKRSTPSRARTKVSTGISGLDDILGGGLPRGRPTLVTGFAGCGKTLLGMQFLVEGIRQQREPGVFMAFEETQGELTENVRSLGFDLDDLVARKRLLVDHVRIERSEIEEAGAFDLEGIFLRLGDAIDTVGAKRVVLDTLETVFSAFSDQSLVRSELRRLFRWLKAKGVTAIITGEHGSGESLTRFGIEEYVADCVITLDHRVSDQVSTRRLKVVKYRGSAHGTNEYPFVIDAGGISVLPITSVGLTHKVSTRRIPSGVPRLDAMLGGKGPYRGSSILVSGTPGAGKSTLAAHFAAATCARNERCLYLAHEESPSQILRNTRSVGIGLQRYVDAGLLRFHSTRPTANNLESHLAAAYRLLREFKPRAFVLDPSTSLLRAGTTADSSAMLFRLVDHLKSVGVTTLFTSLVAHGGPFDDQDEGVSSIMDTWISLQGITRGGEQTRTLQVFKSRGMAHSNQVREFVIGRRGLEILDVDLGPEVRTGSARLAHEAQVRADAIERRTEVERRHVALERRRAVVDAQVAVLRAELASEEDAVMRALDEGRSLEGVRVSERRKLASARWADSLARNSRKSGGGDRP